MSDSVGFLVGAVFLLMVVGLLVTAAVSHTKRVDAFVTYCERMGGKAFEGRHEWACIAADGGIIERISR